MTQLENLMKRNPVIFSRVSELHRQQKILSVAVCATIHAIIIKAYDTTASDM